MNKVIKTCKVICVAQYTRPPSYLPIFIYQSFKLQLYPLISLAISQLFPYYTENQNVLWNFPALRSYRWDNTRLREYINGKEEGNLPLNFEALLFPAVGRDEAASDGPLSGLPHFPFSRGSHSGVTQLKCLYCQTHKTNTCKDTARSGFGSNITANQLLDRTQLRNRGLQALQLPSNRGSSS